MTTGTRTKHLRSPRVLLVRAVNVGGHAKLPMADFRAMLEELGAERARTYIASGNAVVDLPSGWAAPEWAEFDRTVERELESRFGFQRDVISRSLQEVETALADHPLVVDDPKWSYITFLTATPDPERVPGAGEIPTGDDEFSLSGRHMHLRFANGMGDASLNLEKLLQRLGVAGTARNLRSVEAIITLAHK